MAFTPGPADPAPRSHRRARRRSPTGRVGGRGALIAVTAVAALLAGCASSANTASSAASSGATPSTLTIVTPDTGVVWAMDNGFGGYEAAKNLQATLLRKPFVDSAQGRGVQQQDVYTYGPYLAKSYDVSADGLTYTFHLADAVSAAGNKLTAQDVLWSFQRKFATPTSVLPGVMAPSVTDPDSQFKVIDDKTLSITIPNAGLGTTFLALMADLCGVVYDSTLLKQHVTADDPYAVKWSAENPNYGFGPYRVDSYTPGVSAVLKARSDFVLGTPKIATINIRIVPDAGTRANAVKNGDADIAEWVTPADSATLAADPNVIAPQVDNPNSYLMMPLVTNKPPFDNQQVRQAMAYATPYDQIVQNVYRGLAKRQGPGFLLRNAPGYSDAGFPDYTYDPAKAKELLAQAGFPDGVQFTVAVSAAEPDAKEAAIQIQTAAKAAGFTMTIDEQPASQFAQQRVDHSSQAFILRDYAITLTPPYELLVYTAPGSTNNFADWEYQPFYDALAAGNALPDALSDEAGQAWNAAEKIYLDQAPITFIAQVQPNVLVADKVGGYAWTSDQWIDYSNLYFK